MRFIMFLLWLQNISSMTTYCASSYHIDCNREWILETAVECPVTNKEDSSLHLVLGWTEFIGINDLF